MKTLIFLSLMLVLSVGQADPQASDELKLVCATHPLTTSVLIEPEGDVIQVRILHHNGLEFAPIHSGVVASGGFDFLRNKAKNFSRMGERYTLTFERKKCRKYSERVLSCNGGKGLTQDGEVIHASIYTSEVDKKAFGTTFKTIEARVMLQFDGAYLNFAMDYEPRQCI